RHDKRTRNLVLSSILGWPDETRRRLGELQGNVQVNVTSPWGYSVEMFERDVLYPAPDITKTPVVPSGGALFGRKGVVGTMAVAGDGKNVAYASFDPMRQRVVTVWDVASGESKSILPNTQMEMQNLRFSPDSTSLAISQLDQGQQTGAAAGLVTIWKPGETTMRDLNPPGQAVAHSFAWLPDGRYPAMGAPHPA